MATKNKFKLSRTIPAEIMRSVRQRCGFGCVICGNAIYQYEHFNPEFSEARSHNAEGITLLCGGCHDRKSRGLLSQKTVSKANDNPKCLQQEFSFGPFDIGTTHPEIVLGTLKCINVSIPLQVLGDPILKITPPSQLGEIFKISAILRDKNGSIILQIDENQWLTPTTNWDCIVEGQRITLRSDAGQIELILRCEPPNRIVVQKLKMIHLGNIISCEEGRYLILQLPSGFFFKTPKVVINGAMIGIDINQDSYAIGVGGGGVEFHHGFSVGQNYYP